MVSLHSVVLGSANLYLIRPCKQLWSNNKGQLNVILCWNSLVFSINKYGILLIYFENLLWTCSTRNLGPVYFESAGRGCCGDGVVGPSVDSEGWSCVWKLVEAVKGCDSHDFTQPMTAFFLKAGTNPWQCRPRCLWWWRWGTRRTCGWASNWRCLSGCSSRGM